MKPALKPMAGSLRAVLYLRQSTFREESISLEMQESAGRDYCDRMGYVVVAVESDPGISGRTWKRPAVQRVMGMIEERQADVVVLWKWSRLSRSRLDWAVAADKVETAGGRIESATEPLDVSTSAGRLARGMLTEFAAFESERIGDVWKETHQRRIRNGLPANGKPRFGYAYEKSSGFTPDPLTGPVLAETYRRYISGESVYSLVLWLNDGPTRPVSGYGGTSGAWSDRTLRRVLDSGFGAGKIRHGDELLPGAHEPVITGHEWDAYQEARQRRRSYGRAERSEYLLSGLVRCACGSSMNAGMYGTNHTPKYRCKAAHEKRAHTGGYVTASFVEAAVLDWLRERAETFNAITRERSAQRRPRAVVDPGAALRRQVAAVDVKLETLAMRLVDPGIPHDTYVTLRDRLTAEKNAAEAQLRTIAVRSRNAPVSVLPNLIAQWEEMTIPARRELLRSIIDHVHVVPGRPRAVITVHARE